MKSNFKTWMIRRRRWSSPASPNDLSSVTTEPAQATNRLPTKHMQELLLELLIRLEAIGDLDESLYDTVVRENMGNAICDGFIRPVPGYVLPDEYGMPEEENRLIKIALQDFVGGANRWASELGVVSFQERLAAFQDGSVRTEIQRNDSEEFFGWMNPNDFDKDGKVL
jgi:hypothetical protein